MKKDKKIILESAEFFITNHKIRMVNKNIFLNDERILKKDLGHKVFLYVETQIGFQKKWSMLVNDLGKQVISLLS